MNVKKPRVYTIAVRHRDRFVGTVELTGRRYTGAVTRTTRKIR